jgi:hypothetical protein
VDVTIIAAIEDVLRLLAGEEIASEVGASTGVGSRRLYSEVSEMPSASSRPPEFVDVTIIAAIEDVLRFLIWEDVASEIGASTGVGSRRLCCQVAYVPSLGRP